MSKKGKKGALIAVVLLVALGGGGYAALRWATPHYDELIKRREVVRREWAQIDALLQRRYNLIPNLVATVKGYAEHEASIIKEVADAHTGYIKARSRAGKIDASYRVESRMRVLFARCMNYPNLKADAVFIRLMGSLERAEDAITKQRMAYNSAVAELNTLAQSMIGRLVATVSGIEQAAYYNPPARTATVPKVDFSGKRGGAGSPPAAGSAAPGSAAPAAGSGAAAPPKSSISVKDLAVKGIVRRRGRAAKAIIAFPDGRTETVKPGQQILELRAKVVSVDAHGVNFEERTLDARGKPVTRIVRVAR